MACRSGAPIVLASRSNIVDRFIAGHIAADCDKHQLVRHDGAAQHRFHPTEERNEMDGVQSSMMEAETVEDSVAFWRPAASAP